MPAWTLEAEGLHLRRTLDSGQAFRWRWEARDGGPGVATGIVGSHRLRVAQDARGIHLLAPATATARDALARYLTLPTADAARAGDGPPGLRRIEALLAADAVLARVLPRTRGITLLVQDPWEVLISFIVSQNNNIPKITRSIEGLARALGEPLGEGVYAFPSPARLAAAHPATLRACHLGYRAPYVRGAARRVAEGRLDLDRLCRIPEDEAREALRELPGIGDKVADCILLFALGKVTTFPVDVWIRRAVERLYLGGRPTPLREIRAFARDRFGPLAGYAQQHLFVYAREHLRDLDGRDAVAVIEPGDTPVRSRPATRPRTRRSRG
ncbi:MAG TPA: DNA glycosylase [bacterium]|nr:DNA glycosylase [bacterium]